MPGAARPSSMPPTPRPGPGGKRRRCPRPRSGRRCRRRRRQGAAWCAADKAGKKTSASRRSAQSVDVDQPHRHLHHQLIVDRHHLKNRLARINHLAIGMDLQGDHHAHHPGPAPPGGRAQSRRPLPPSYLPPMHDKQEASMAASLGNGGTRAASSVIKARPHNTKLMALDRQSRSYVVRRLSMQTATEI